LGLWNFHQSLFDIVGIDNEAYFWLFSFFIVELPYHSNTFFTGEFLISMMTNLYLNSKLDATHFLKTLQTDKIF
jgi:hypothetical protein